MTDLSSWLLLQTLDMFNERLASIEAKLDSITRRAKAMSLVLDNLKAQVARNTSLEQSAIALIQGLAQQIRDAAGDPAALAELATNLETSATSLSDAFVANTPAAPPA